MLGLWTATFTTSRMCVHFLEYLKLRKAGQNYSDFLFKKRLALLCLYTYYKILNWNILIYVWILTTYVQFRGTDEL